MTIKSMLQNCEVQTTLSTGNYLINNEVTTPAIDRDCVIEKIVPEHFDDGGEEVSEEFLKEFDKLVNFICSDVTKNSLVRYVLLKKAISSLTDLTGLLLDDSNDLYAMYKPKQVCSIPVIQNYMKKSYTYPEAVSVMETALKALKAECVKTGAATSTETIPDQLFRVLIK